MKIATASSVILNYDVRKDAAVSLAAGESVSIIPTPGHEADSAGKVRHSPELVRDIKAGRSAIAAISIDERVRKELNLSGLAIGGAGGAIVGAGIGVLLDQLKTVHPASAPLFDAACAAIGLGVGGVVGSNTMRCKIGYSLKEGVVSLDLEGVKP